MPAPTLQCEFCENEMRRDAYPTHVKAKHEKELCNLLIADFKEYNMNTISAFSAQLKVTSMPIYSKMYLEGEYWFGVKPYFHMRESQVVPDKGGRIAEQKPYKEDTDLSNYLKSEQNLTAHREFLEGLLRSISVMDLIDAQRNINIRNADLVLVKKELRTIQEEHARLKTTSEAEIERLKKEVAQWKETADEKEFIGEIKRDLLASRASEMRLERKIVGLTNQLNAKDAEFEERWISMNTSRMTQAVESDRMNDKLRADIAEMKEKYEKLQGRVKVEAQKIVDKQQEAKKKAKEKKELEKMKAKKMAKKAKKLAELSDSDSDSDSSDSDTE